MRKIFSIFLFFNFFAIAANYAQTPAPLISFFSPLTDSPKIQCIGLVPCTTASGTFVLIAPDAVLPGPVLVLNWASTPNGYTCTAWQAGNWYTLGVTLLSTTNTSMTVGITNPALPNYPMLIGYSCTAN